MNEKIQRKEKTVRISEETNTYHIIQSENNDEENSLLSVTKDLVQSEQNDERLVKQLHDDLTTKMTQLKQTRNNQLALHKENVRLNKFLELGETYRLDLTKSVHDTRSSIKRVIADIHKAKSSPVLPLLKDKLEAAEVFRKVQTGMFERLEVKVETQTRKRIDEAKEEVKMMKLKNEMELGRLRDVMQKAMEENTKLRQGAVHRDEMEKELQEKRFQLTSIRESLTEIEAKEAREMENKRLLKQKIKDFENRITEGTFKLNELENQKDVQNKRRLELAENTVRLENDNKRIKIDIANNKQLLLELDEHLKQINEVQKRKLTELDVTFNGFKSLLDQENDEILKLQQDMEKQTDEEADLNKTLNTLGNEMTTLNNKRQDLLNVTRNIETEHTKIIKKITDLTLQCNEVADEINKITDKTTTIHNNFEEDEVHLKSEIETAEKRIEEETAMHKTTVVQIIENHKTHMEEIKKSHDFSVSELQASIEALEDVARQKAAEKKNLETEMNSVAAECNIMAGRNTRRTEEFKRPAQKKVYSLEEVLRKKKKHMAYKH